MKCVSLPLDRVWWERIQSSIDRSLLMTPCPASSNYNASTCYYFQITENHIHILNCVINYGFQTCATKYVNMFYKTCLPTAYKKANIYLYHATPYVKILYHKQINIYYIQNYNIFLKHACTLYMYIPKFVNLNYEIPKSFFYIKNMFTYLQHVLNSLLVFK